MNKDEKILAGQGLRGYIIEEMGNIDLSLDHQFKLHNIITGSGGDFIPNDLQLALMDVRIWIVEGEYDKLLSLAKQLPTVTNGSIIMYYINGEKVSRGRYFSADKIKGVRTIRGTRATKERLDAIDEDKFRKSMFANTKLGEIKGLQLFGASYCEPHSKGDIDFDEPDIAEPVSTAKDSTPRQDDEDEIGANAEEESYSPDELGDDKNTPNPNEFEFNEPSREPWVNRPRGATDE